MWPHTDDGCQTVFLLAVEERRHQVQSPGLKRLHAAFQTDTLGNTTFWLDWAQTLDVYKTRMLNVLPLGTQTTNCSWLEERAKTKNMLC